MLTLIRSLFATLLSGCLFTVQAENFVSLYQTAIVHDPILNQARATKQATLQQVPIAASALLPTLAGEGTIAGYSSTNVSLNRYNLSSYGVSLSMPLVDLSSWAALGQANHLRQGAIATLISAEQALIIRLAQQYFAILSAQDNLKFIQGERTAIKRHLDQTKQKFDVGLIAITDVHEAQARYDKAYAEELTAQHSVMTEYEKMQEILGRPCKKLWRVQPNLQLVGPTPEHIDKWVDSALAHNFDLQATHFTTKAAHQAIWQSRASHLPTLNGSASLYRSKSTPPTAAKDTLRSVGITLSVPIFQGGQIYSETQQKIYEYDLASQQLEAQRRTVISQTRQAYRSVQTKISEVRALAQAVISSQSALNATQSAFDVGTRTIVDVLNAQRDLLRAQRDHARARYDYLLQGLVLKQYAGSLGMQDVTTLNAALTKHKSPVRPKSGGSPTTTGKQKSPK